MNSLTLIRDLIEEKNEIEIDQHLSMVWDSVWSDKGALNYERLRLAKTIDKVKKLSLMGIDFQDRKVLDMGCGNGITLAYLNKNFNVSGVGIDISSEVVNSLSEKFKDNELNFFIGDHRNLPNILSDQFDIVLSFGVIEHFDEYNLALAEARRVLKNSGKLILIQPHLFSFGVLQEYCLRIRKKWKFGNQRDFSCFYYRSILKKMGFKNILYKSVPPYKDMNITRIIDSAVKKLLPFWGHYLYIICEK